MRIAVLSDIHGNLLALKAVLHDLAHRQVGTIVNLGDSLSGPLQPSETAAFLMAQPWVQLAGNHERQLLDFAPERRGPSDRYAHSQLGSEVFEWMATLRHAQPLNEEVFLCHGTPRSDIEYFLDTVDAPSVRAATHDEIDERLGPVAAAVVVCGHTHIPRMVRSRAGQLLVNPGSVGLQAYEDESPAYHVVENNSPNARYAIVEKRGGTWQAQLLAVPYDHAGAADLARQRGRPDWEVALMCGRMKAANPPLQPTASDSG
jgi:predicted phosphodiesterase